MANIKEKMAALVANKKVLAGSVIALVVVIILIVVGVNSCSKKDATKEATATDAVAKVTEEATTEIEVPVEVEEKAEVSYDENGTPLAATVEKETYSLSGVVSETDADGNVVYKLSDTEKLVIDKNGNAKLVTSSVEKKKVTVSEAESILKEEAAKETTTAETTTEAQTEAPTQGPAYTFTDANATKYAKSVVNVRDLPSTDGNRLGGLTLNQAVTVTGICNETGWYRISFDGAVGYVADGYLLDTPVEAQTEAPTQAPVASGNTGSTGGSSNNNSGSTGSNVDTGSNGSSGGSGLNSPYYSAIDEDILEDYPEFANQAPYTAFAYKATHRIIATDADAYEVVRIQNNAVYKDVNGVYQATYPDLESASANVKALFQYALSAGGSYSDRHFGTGTDGTEYYIFVY